MYLELFGFFILTRRYNLLRYIIKEIKSRPQEKITNILWIVLAIAMIGYFVFSVITDPVEHIEDSNGMDDTSIATIKEEEIIDYLSKGSKGMGCTKKDVKIAGWQLGGVKFHSKKFSGVEPLLRTNIIFSAGFDLNIYDYKVNGGNFRLYVLNEGKIIDVLEPSDKFDHHYENIKGEFTVVAVGECADFEFKMTTSEYDEYYHFAFEEN